MKKNNSFVDMDSIRKIGLKQFSEIYYWPISDNEFEYFVNQILYEFEQILVDVDEDVFDLVIADYRFLVFILQHIHYRAVLSRFNSKGQHHMEHGPTLTAMLNPDWNAHIAYFSRENLKTGHFGNYRNSAKSQIGGRMRHISNSIIANRHRSIVKQLLQIVASPKHVSIGPLTEFKREFLKNRKDYVRIAEWNYFGIPMASSEGTFSRRLQKQVFDPFFNCLIVQSNLLGTEIDANSISHAWQERLVRLYGMYSVYRKIKTTPEEISITAAGNPIRKTLATALQRSGTKVYVLHHGECAGVEKYPHAHRNDGSFCNYFVCPTKQITNNFRFNYSNSLLEKRSGTRYISSESSHYENLYHRYRSGRPSRQYKTIMLIGFGMSPTRYLDGAGYFSYFQLDVQYRVAQLIKLNGYQLIYKVHPDRADEVGNLFAEIADHVEKRRFEDVWDSPDGYVFTHPGSTVFGHTVLTKKPMLLVDLYNNNWNEPGYELLRLRCNMVSSNFDSTNRIIFDESEFSEKLNNPLSLDDGYVNEFLLGTTESETLST